MKISQEPKYIIEGPVVNRQSGVAIPDDEPVFLLRARDFNAVETLKSYLEIARSGGCDKEHQTAIKLRMRQFSDFAHWNKKRMKTPDTTLTPDWE